MADLTKIERPAHAYVTGVCITYIHNTGWQISALSFALKPGRLLGEGETLAAALANWEEGHERVVR